VEDVKVDVNTNDDDMLPKTCPMVWGDASPLKCVASGIQFVEELECDGGHYD